MKLVCCECHVPRNKCVEPVYNDKGEPIGWRCVKCIRKRAVGGNAPARPGQGWRRRLRDLVSEIRSKAAGEKQKNKALRRTP